jgi:hypothetical protein
MVEVGCRELTCSQISPHQHGIRVVVGILVLQHIIIVTGVEDACPRYGKLSTEISFQNSWPRHFA